MALPKAVSAAVRNVDDDIVALVALDLEQQNLLQPTDSRLWGSRIRADNLYSDHWLLAYEASAQGWLPSSDGTDFLASDPFFSILFNGGVRFYDAGETWEEGYSDYSDGDEEISESEGDHDDESGTEPDRAYSSGDTPQQATEPEVEPLF